MHPRLPPKPPIEPLPPRLSILIFRTSPTAQARIVAINSHMFLKNEGHTVISVKANCIDSTAPAEHVFAKEVQKLQAEQFKPMEQLTLEPYERDHAVVVAQYRPAKKQKTS